VYINTKAPSSAMDTFAEALGSVIYPLQVITNAKAEIMGIANHTAIQQRWASKRERIARAYTGASITATLTAMDAVIANRDRLHNTIVTQDWFVSLFFTKFYLSDAYPKATRQLRLPILPYTFPIQYEANDTMQYRKPNSGDLLIQRTGDCIDTRTEDDLAQGIRIGAATIPSLQGKLQLDYHLYAASPIWDAIIGNVQLKLPSGTAYRVTIEAYHLKTKTPKTAIEKQMDIERILKEMPLPKRKKKRYFLFGKEIKI